MDKPSAFGVAAAPGTNPENFAALLARHLYRSIGSPTMQ